MLQLLSSTDHHKFWSNVAYLTATIAFAKICWQAQPSDGLSMLFFVYLGTVGGSALANAFIMGRLGAKAPEQKEGGNP